ncbi:MAG: ABC transporter substrate-binding protein [Bdellovibrionales bacterium]|nr:ABC transporter substrate-binding protein [Bdellovibrionales bacterium]
MRLLVLLFLVLLSAQAHAENAPLKVGVTIALSGPLAEYGIAVKNGIELAKKKHPELFSHIHFLYEDDAYDPKRGVLNFQKLRSVDKIHILFSWGVEPSLSIAPLAEKYHLPFITQSLLPEISRGKKYVVRFAYNGEKHGQILSQYLHKAGKNNIGLIMSDLSFFDLLTQGIKKHLKEDQNLTVIESVLPSETDFKSLLLRKDIKQYDTLGVYLLPSQIRLFYKQAHQLGIKLDTFGTTTFESTTILEDVMPLIEGVPFTHSATTDTFLKDFQHEYKDTMHIGYAASAYDFAVVLGKLVEQEMISSDSTPEAIIAAFRQTKPFTGAAGKTIVKSSKEHGTYFDSEISVKRYKNGIPEVVYSLP